MSQQNYSAIRYNLRTRVSRPSASIGAEELAHSDEVEAQQAALDDDDEVLAQESDEVRNVNFEHKARALIHTLCSASRQMRHSTSRVHKRVRMTRDVTAIAMPQMRTTTQNLGNRKVHLARQMAPIPKDPETGTAMAPRSWIRLYLRDRSTASNAPTQSKMRKRRGRRLPSPTTVLAPHLAARKRRESIHDVRA